MGYKVSRGNSTNLERNTVSPEGFIEKWEDVSTWFPK